MSPCYRECGPPSSARAPAWLVAVSQELAQGQSRLVTHLLEHQGAKLFCHDYNANLRAKDVPTTPEKASTPPATKEEAPENHLQESDIKPETKKPYDIKNNLFKEDTTLEKAAQTTLLFASGTFMSLIAPTPTSLRSLHDSLTGQSILSFSSPVPSSISTDRPPSPLSISSYGVDSTKTVPVEKLDPRKFKKCKVQLRALKVSVLPRNKVIHRAPTPSIASTDSTSADSDSITSEDLCDIIEDQKTGANMEDVEEEHADYAVDLSELKSLADNRGFSSIMELHLNTMKILSSFPLPECQPESVRKNLLDRYQELMEEFFPWFDIQNPARHWTEWQPREEPPPLKVSPVKVGAKRQFHVAKPDNEHTYAMPLINPKEKYSYDDIDEDQEDEEDDENKEQDCRKCLFCGEVGNGDIHSSGRLLSLR